MKATVQRLAGAVTIAVFAAFAAATPAMAEIETAAQTQARSAVESQAAAIGVAPTEAQAVKDQAALMPAVKKAVASGVNAMSLVEHANNPSVTADVIKASGGLKVKRTKSTAPKHTKPALKRNGTEGKEITLGVQAARHRPRAHAADACWSGAWTMEEWAIAPGAIVGWVYANAGAWCGRYGWWLYWYGGPTLAQWSWGGGDFCMANINQSFTWDVYPTWIHTGEWGTLGLSYPWGCWGVFGSGRAVVRIAANGYWDTYDDFGF